jgi:hypothetical protein
MCVGKKPKAPKIPDPQPPQQPDREPDVPITRRKTQLTGPRPPSGTLLTGTGGVPAGSLSTASNTLLGA